MPFHVHRFLSNNPLRTYFPGDLKKADDVLIWLTDDDVREIEGEIELVNARLFKRVLQESDFVLVLFCKLVHLNMGDLAWTSNTMIAPQTRMMIRKVRTSYKSWKILTMNVINLVITLH